MIPIRLLLSNFMSYPDDSPPVDFTTFHLACLSGENGHGKSALLDAITWVLWGKARSHVDSLVRLGQQEMRVEFEFMINDTRYLVIRKRSLKGSGSTHTELYVVSTDGEHRAQSDGGERTTQEKLIRLLRMEYQTFINSAFILQGRTDEFARKEPTERKKILAEILDLERYDRLEEISRDRHRIAADRGGILQREIENLRLEMAHKPEYESSLSAARQALEEARGAMEKRQQEIDRRQSEMAALNAQVTLLASLKEREQRRREEASRSRQKGEELRKRLAVLKQKLERRPVVEQQIILLAQAREEMAEMDRVEKQDREAEKEQQSLEIEILKLRHQIESHRAGVEARLKDLNQRASQVPRLQAAIENLRRVFKPSAGLEKAMDLLREEWDAQTRRREGAQSDTTALEREMERLSQRKALLGEPSAVCPLCAQPLGEDGQSHLLEEMEQETNCLREQRRQFELERAAAEGSLKQINTKVKALKAEIEKSRKAEQEAAGLEVELREARSAAECLADAQRDLAQIQQDLDSDLNPALTARLRELKSLREKLGYNRGQHEKLKIHIRQLTPAEREHQDLEHAEGEREDLVARLEETESLILQYVEEAESLQKQVAALAPFQAEKEKLEREILRLSQERDSFGRSASTAQMEVGRWEDRLQQCAVCEQQERQKREELGRVNKDAAIYKDLVIAFGKKGIQAMIIENVTPEIETEANRLLSLMSDNGMQIQFRTQKGLKKGGEAETLEIIIGDQMGDRPYECYSGGEAFRINFAIRIALSRLLARRSGAQLQTIVIDEGFGSQDAQGRKRLVEAIHSVKDEFARVLVVTHLDDLKDEFPVRLHVSKSEGGSRVVMLT